MIGPLGKKALQLIALWLVSAAATGYCYDLMAAGNRLTRIPLAIAALGVGWSAYRIIHEDDPEGISDHLGLVGYMLAMVLTGILAWRWLTVH